MGLLVGWQLVQRGFAFGEGLGNLTGSLARTVYRKVLAQ